MNGCLFCLFKSSSRNMLFPYGFTSLVTLMLSFRIAITLQIYYFTDTIRNATDITEIYNNNKITRIVLDFLSIHHLEVFLDGTSGWEIMFRSIVDLRKNSFSKPTFARFLQIDSPLKGGGTINKLEFKKSNVKIENYLGCFSRHINPIISLKSIGIVTNLDECEHLCNQYKFYGVDTTGSCFCIRNMTQVNGVSLRLCDNTCPSANQICGGDSVISVYMKTRQRTQAVEKDYPHELFWSDLIKQHCPIGVIGYECEYSYCPNNNGNCAANKECEDLLWNDLKIGFCRCKRGFFMSDNLECYDQDECSTEGYCDTESTLCLNELGSFKCLCKLGYDRFSQTPLTCQDINECHTGNICDFETTLCVNAPGSYLCECLKGYKRFNTLACTDIDECEEFVHDCGKDSTCVNSLGSYECRCPLGSIVHIYQYAVECHDNNECSDPYACDNSVSFCLNIPFSYICQCYPDYVNVDSFTCKIAPSKPSTLSGYTKATIITEDYEISTPSELNEYLDYVVENGVFIIIFIIGLSVLYLIVHMVRKKTGQRVTPPSTVTTFMVSSR